MSLSSLLDGWQSDPQVAPNIVTWRTIAARPGRWAPFPPELHPYLVDQLRARHIQALYSHQATTWQHVQAGRHVVIVTGTASGKTLCYNLPVLDHLLRAPTARALYLFPTKALAHDQQDELSAWLAAGRPSSGQASIGVASYDGDTPAEARPAVRNRAQLIISNPDMLHTGILPHHTAWADFFKALRFVIIDEMHTYRGVFGSHVANVLRRLKRVARFYGAAPQFILTSATIGNPLQLAEKLIEEPVVLVDDDGAARGARHFLIYNPPVVNRELGLRRGLLLEGVRLTRQLLAHGVQTIVFGRTRHTVELFLRYLRQTDQRAAPSTSEGTWPAPGPPVPAHSPEQSAGLKSEAVRGYRSGYLPAHRRSIEQGLREGQVRAVVATSALELGIDIGGMGAAVLAGYPGSIARTWQQAGRAGRQHETALAVLIASADPLDQFLASHPDYFFERSPEQALINPDHLLILLQHVRCAAFELPFQAGDSFGRVEAERLAEYLEFLQEAGVLHRSRDRYFWMADQYPAEQVSLRSASPETVVLQVEQDGAPQTLGLVDTSSAPWLVHPDAVYLHEGRTYLVEDLDLTNGVARLRPAEVAYYTEPRSQAQVQLVEKHAEAPAPGALIVHGALRVVTQLTGYRKVKWLTHELLGSGELSLPPSELQTTGYWLALTPDTLERLRQAGLWNSDINRYGPDWPRLRDQARKRDGYRCQNCGAPEGEHAHHVHHKQPFRSFASAQQANQLSNLVTLCPGCHQRAELAVRTRSGLAGVAYALHHLAPLFLMCDTHDLGVHADPQSPLGAGQPTVVLYDLVPAGIGFSQRLFELHSELVGRAYELVAACACSDGCPSCVGPAGEAGAGGKQEARALLQSLAGL